MGHQLRKDSSKTLFVCVPGNCRFNGIRGRREWQPRAGRAASRPGQGSGAGARWEEQRAGAGQLPRKLCHQGRGSRQPGALPCVLTFRPATDDWARFGKTHVLCTSISSHPSLRAVVPRGGQGRNHRLNSLSAFRKPPLLLCLPRGRQGQSLQLHVGLCLCPSVSSLSLFVSSSRLASLFLCLSGLESSLPESLSPASLCPLRPYPHIPPRSPLSPRMWDRRASLTYSAQRAFLGPSPFPSLLPVPPPGQPLLHPPPPAPFQAPLPPPLPPFTFSARRTTGPPISLSFLSPKMDRCTSTLGVHLGLSAPQRGQSPGGLVWVLFSRLLHFTKPAAVLGRRAGPWLHRCRSLVEGPRFTVHISPRLRSS